MTLLYFRGSRRHIVVQRSHFVAVYEGDASIGICTRISTTAGSFDVTDSYEDVLRQLGGPGGQKEGA